MQDIEQDPESELPYEVIDVSARKKMRYTEPTSKIENVLLLEATQTVREMSSLVMKNDNQDPFDIFGKFVASELREISGAGNQSVLILAKRKIQQAIMDAWEFVDAASNIDPH